MTGAPSVNAASTWRSLGSMKREADTLIPQSQHERLERGKLPGRVEAALGRSFLAFFGDDAGGMRAVGQGNP